MFRATTAEKPENLGTRKVKDILGELDLLFTEAIEQVICCEILSLYVIVTVMSLKLLVVKILCLTTWFVK